MNTPVTRAIPHAGTRRRPRPQAARPGFSMVEATISVLIVGVLLVVAMNAAAAAAASQGASAHRATARLLADALMAEVLQQAYQEPAQAVSYGAETGEVVASGSRAGFDDVDDYNLYKDEPPVARDGTALTGMSGWKRKVSVDRVQSSDLAKVNVETGLKLITIKVSRNDVDHATATALRGKGW